jgi:hypothetical protein
MLGSRKNSKLEKGLKMPQNPTRQVHAVLASRKLNGTHSSTRKTPGRTARNNAGKRTLQKTPAHIMTRRRARCYNYFVTKRRDLRNEKFTDEQNEPDKKERCNRTTQLIRRHDSTYKTHGLQKHGGQSLTAGEKTDIIFQSSSF